MQSIVVPVDPLLIRARYEEAHSLLKRLERLERRYRMASFSEYAQQLSEISRISEIEGKSCRRAGVAGLG